MKHVSEEVVLNASNINMHFPIYKGLVFRKKVGAVKAVNGVSIDLRRGETIGLVGESGCGKSTLGRCLVRLYEPTSGRVEVSHIDITDLQGESLRNTRKDYQMIFQDPYASLNPRMTVFDIIAEPLKTHRMCQNNSELKKTVSDLMVQVGLSPGYVRKYPHEFSGGQRQRIAIARALAVKPKVIVCDEPVSALDVSIQAQILNLLKDLQAEFNVSYLFIAHDLAAVRYISDRVAVMYLGKIVEFASRDELFKNPKHPYTKALMSSIPVADPRVERSRERILLTGDLPSPMNLPTGCAFHTRCNEVFEKCSKVEPEQVQFPDTNHQVNCHLYGK